MNELNYKIIRVGINDSRIVYGSDNVYYCLLDFLFDIDVTKVTIPEKIMNICEEAQNWCEIAEFNGKYLDEKFTIEVVSEQLKWLIYGDVHMNNNVEKKGNISKNIEDFKLRMMIC